MDVPDLPEPYGSRMDRAVIAINPFIEQIVDIAREMGTSEVELKSDNYRLTITLDE